MLHYLVHVMKYPVGLTIHRFRGPFWWKIVDFRVICYLLRNMNIKDSPRLTGVGSVGISHSGPVVSFFGVVKTSDS